MDCITLPLLGFTSLPLFREWLASPPVAQANLVQALELLEKDKCPHTTLKEVFDTYSQDSGLVFGEPGDALEFMNHMFSVFPKFGTEIQTSLNFSCGHFKARTETVPYYQISREDLKDLHLSEKLLETKSTKREAYPCPECGEEKELTITEAAVSFPSTFFVSLQRLSFDFETMTRVFDDTEVPCKTVLELPSGTYALKFTLLYSKIGDGGAYLLWFPAGSRAEASSFVAMTSTGQKELGLMFPAAKKLLRQKSVFFAYEKVGS